jgi:SAM-dependent methyltransferase
MLHLGRRLTALGERWGVQWLIENPLTFRYYHRLAAENAPAAVSAFEAVFPEARTFVDVGAGSGAYAAELRRRGMTVVAYEYSRVGRAWARAQRVDCRPLDLTADQPVAVRGRFDLAYSFEVAQQVDERLGMRLVDLLCPLAETVVFSSAQPGQGGAGPRTLRPKQFWIDAFEARGMRHLPALSERWVAEYAARGGSAYWLLENVAVFEPRRERSI